MFRFARCAAVPALCALLPGPTSASSTTPMPTQFPSDTVVQRLVEERIEDGGGTGLVVGILDSDGTTRIFHAGTGGSGTAPLGPSSVFQIGSISKVLTGTLLADMARRGEISPNDPIDAHLPEGVVLPHPVRRTVSLADLATHRSGLPGVPRALPMGELSDPYADFTVDHLHRSLAGNLRRNGEMKRFRYSNLGVGLLGQLLASRLGSTWEEAIRERVLEPLAMTATRLVPADGAPVVKGHDLGGLPVPPWDFGALAPAGGLHSTADDLLRFLAANVGEARTGLEHAMRIAQHPRARLDHEWTVGLTWSVRDAGGRRTVWHGGAAGGQRAFLGFDPDLEIGVVILANSVSGVDDLGFHLLDPEIPLAPPTVPRFATRDEVPVPEALLRRYVGDYFLRPGAPLRIRLEEGRLWAMVPGKGPHPAYGDGQGGFFLRAADVELRFEIDGSGKAALAVLRIDGRTARALRMAEPVAKKGRR